MTTRLLILVGLILAVVLPFDTAPAQDAGRRIALVIGNAKYPDADAPLKEPIADMNAMADELKRSGFDVTRGENLKRDGMQKALDAFYGRIKAGSVVLVFFSGYGIQSGRQSFLIPVDGQLWTEGDVRRDGFSLDTILGEINTRGASTKIAILDASRRNPFERRFRNYSSGLAPATAPQGSLVMYSAAPGTVVPDATNEHSLFINELLKEIRVPGLTAEEALNRTRVGVSRASQGDQVPWFSSSLVEEFSFGPGPVDSAAKPPPQTQATLTPSTKVETPEVVTPRPQTPSTPPVVTAPSVPELPKPNVANPPPAAIPPVTPPPAIPSATAQPQQIPPVQAPSSPPTDKFANLANDPAIRDLTTLLTDNPNDQAAYYKRGQIYASKGAYNPALSDFDQAIRLNPRDVEALNNRCWVRTIIGELQSALKDCNDALQLRPNFVDALDSRGLVNLKLGLVANALNDFDAALKLNPKLASSLYGRGLARQRSGLAAAGDRDIQAAKQISPDITGEFSNYGIR